MILKIENDVLKEIETNEIRAKTLNVYDIDFEFSPDWDELTKKIVYIYGDDVWQEAIIDDKSIVPPLPSGRAYGIGVVGYIEEENIMIKIKSTNLIYKNITTSAAEYEPNQEIEEIGARTYERYLQEITAKALEINGYVGRIEELATQIHNDEVKVQENTDLVEELAKGVQDTATAIQFATFDVDDDGNLVIYHANKMKNTLFSINEETGDLEVEIVNV